MDDAQFQRLHEDLNQLRREISAFRVDLQNNMIDVAILQSKVGIVATVAALLASAAFSVVGRVFF